MGNIVTSLLHQSTRTSTSGRKSARLHGCGTQPATMTLGSSHPGSTAMDVEGIVDDPVECETVANALRNLERACTLAVVSAHTRTTAPASLEFVRNAFNAARNLRSMLMSERENLLGSHEPSLTEITVSLEESLEALQYALRYLHRHHGLAYMVDIVDRGNADQATQEMFVSLRKPNRLIVRDETTAAGVQAIREIVGPLNEVHVALDVARRIATGRNIDDLPF
jgi:hypothetical protein